VRRALAVLLALAAQPVLAADDDLLAVGPGELAKVWQREDRKINVRLDATDTKANVGCAAVSFIIEPNGRTSNFKLLRSVPEGDFQRAAKDVVAGFRFVPGTLNAKREAVFTYITITFNMRRDRTLGSNIRQPITIDERLNRMCAVEGFDFGG
jgi:TonB family protein